MAETDPSGSPLPGNLETEFDLRDGILILAAWWREILCLAVMTMVLGVAAFISAPGKYEASADVVVLRARSGVIFDDERFKTVGTVGERGWQPAAELPAGQDTLLGLASSGAVALSVSERLKEEGGNFQWEPTALMNSVNAELLGVRSNPRARRGQAGAMVRITAQADSPAYAALIANAWAEAYVDYVNTLYAPNSAEQLASITGELTEAQGAYDVAQRELEEFVSHSEARRVEQEIQARVAVLEEYFNSAVKSLNEDHATRRRLRRLMAAAQSLRDQVDSGGAAGVVSNGLAIQLLKVEAYGDDSPDLTLDLGNFSDTHVDAAAQRADVKALHQALQGWLARVEHEIARQRAALLSTEYYRTLATPGEFGAPVPDDAAANGSLEGHYEDIRSLEARLEALNRRKEQLTSQRDRLLTTLDVLRNKDAEFRLAAAVSQPELRLGSPAVQPLPVAIVGRHLLRPAGASAFVGVLLGVAVAFIGNLLGRRPFLSRGSYSE